MFTLPVLQYVDDFQSKQMTGGAVRSITCIPPVTTLIRRRSLAPASFPSHVKKCPECEHAFVNFDQTSAQIQASQDIVNLINSQARQAYCMIICRLLQREKNSR